MISDKKILIVGGGIGGMATAIRMAELGASVHLIDLDPDWKVYGAGITITGPTLRAYKRLCMIEQLKEIGSIFHGSRIFRFDGVHLQDMDEPALEDDLPATGGIMRPDLHRLMQKRIRELDIPVDLGITVTGLTNTDDGVDVSFSNGESGHYDVVVGADSIFSAVRKIAFPHMSEAKETGQGCWRISIAKPPGQDRGEFYFGHPQYTAGITPCAEDKVYMWMLTRHEEREDFMNEQELYDGMKANLKEFGGNAGWIRDNMTMDDWINYRPLAAVIQPKPWYNGNIVLLGDAVHATTPHLASGAGMAVESAIVLADELEKAASVSEGLKAFQERRYERCRDIVESSISIGESQLEGAGPDVVGGKIGAALYRLAADF